jgi:hypothetical protein
MPPIIFLPGLFASWNKKALVYGQPVRRDEWKINPIVREYDGIIKTLKNIGYRENENLFIFCYDWRKSIMGIADDLKTFIDEKVVLKNPSTHINLIGHSLGGLVGRIYLQKYLPNKINTLITVGTPHKGAAQAYRAIEGGELDRSDYLFWLGQKIIVEVCKNGKETDREIIHDRMPVVRDLLPTYPFLINEDGREIPLEKMQVKNSTLLGLNNNVDQVLPYLKTIAGKKGKTVWGYVVGKRNLFDRILGFYPDGRPVEEIKKEGDFVVTSESAGIGSNSETSMLDHTEIIFEKQMIKRILNILNLACPNEAVTEGRMTKMFPSLLFLIMSPAAIEVSYENSCFFENDGLVYIEGARAGTYYLQVKGRKRGKYSVLAGQVTKEKDTWSRIEGITKPGQIDWYAVNFGPNRIYQIQRHKIAAKITDGFRRKILGKYSYNP